jgi:hypothetical protein
MNQTMSSTESLAGRLDKLQWRSLVIGLAALAALAVCGIGVASNRQQALRSYLVGYLFWWGIAVGCLGLTMIAHLVSSHWGRAAQPYFAAGIGTLPLLAVLFLPVALGLQDLYVWARADAVAADVQLQKKVAYLNPAFFNSRAAGYFAVWLLFGWLLRRRPVSSDSSDDQASSRLAGVSGIGLVWFMLTTTFAAFDWSMSLEPHWYSTIYGLVIGTGSVLTAMAFVILILAQLGDRSAAGNSSVDDGTAPQTLSDLATLLMAFLLLWAYLDFSQFLIIWSGNLPVESAWYLCRLQGGWQWIALGVVLFHFAAPFLLLLSRETKCSPRAMTVVVVMLLFMHWVELFWNVAPTFHTTALHIHWLDLTAPAGIGGLWIWMFVRELRSQLR